MLPSAEEQSKTGNWSLRSDVPAAYCWQPILSYKVIDNYFAFLTTSKQFEDLRNHVEAYTGPVRNVEGVQ
jgi:hypothetical protein